MQVLKHESFVAANRIPYVLKERHSAKLTNLNKEAKNLSLWEEKIDCMGGLQNKKSSVYNIFA